MKIDLKDLKAAVKWLEANSPDTIIKAETINGVLELKAQDRYGVQVLIEIYESGTIQPTIMHKDRLKI